MDVLADVHDNRWEHVEFPKALRAVRNTSTWPTPEPYRRRTLSGAPVWSGETYHRHVWLTRFRTDRQYCQHHVVVSAAPWCTRHTHLISEATVRRILADPNIAVALVGCDHV